jgi:hypothetical protein
VHCNTLQSIVGEGRSATLTRAQHTAAKTTKPYDRPKVRADGWREDWPEWAKYEINWPSRRDR